MAKASRFFTDFEKSRIHEAVAEAENKTSAEIVPALATSSGRYDRAEDVAGLWLGVILLALAWFFLQGQGAEEADWGSTWSRYELLVLIGSVVIGFIVGAFLAGFIQPIRRMFTPRKEMRDEVENSAAQVFFDQRVHHTKGGTGLLIYVSLFERMASIIADQSIMDALGQPAIDELCSKLIDGIRAGDAATALTETVTDAGERLAAIMPRAGDDRNELPNQLVIID